MLMLCTFLLLSNMEKKPVLSEARVMKKNKIGEFCFFGCPVFGEFFIIGKEYGGEYSDGECCIPLKK